MSARVLNNPLESVPMVLGALRDALLELQEAGSTPALLLRIEALAALLPGAGPVPMGLQELASAPRRLWALSPKDPSDPRVP